MNRPLIALLAPLFLTLQACANSATAPAAPPASLVGTQWTLTALGEQAVMPQSKATLGFPEAGRVAGHGSCNRFSGAVTVHQSGITFGNLASTKMACMGEAMAQETAYLSALQKAQRFERKEETLLIQVQGMAKPLRFTLVK